jgi:hypothetical protein
MMHVDDYELKVRQFDITMHRAEAGMKEEAGVQEVFRQSQRSITKSLCHAPWLRQSCAARRLAVTKQVLSSHLDRSICALRGKESAKKKCLRSVQAH